MAINNTHPPSTERDKGATVVFTRRVSVGCMSGLITGADLPGPLNRGVYGRPLPMTPRGSHSTPLTRASKTTVISPGMYQV